jgi:hypothetical protein
MGVNTSSKDGETVREEDPPLYPFPNTTIAYTTQAVVLLGYTIIPLNMSKMNPITMVQNKDREGRYYRASQQ